MKYCKIEELLNKQCLNKYNKVNNTDSTNINKTHLNIIQNEILQGIRSELMDETFNTTNIKDGKDIIIEEEGIKFILTSINNQINNIENKNITNINLGKCETELRNKYHISGDIYIIKIDKEVEGLKIPKIEYEVYAYLDNNKLEKLNLNICEKIKIDIYIPYNLSKDDEDIYDIKSGYYTNICYIYTANVDFDLSLFDRKNEFIENNKTLCEEDCDFEKYDETIGKVICSCLTKIKMPLIPEISFDKNKIIEKFKNVKSLININLLKCYYLLLNKKWIIKNIGFYSSCPILIIYIISLLVFCHKGTDEIEKIINDIINAKKNIENNKGKKNSQSKNQDNPPLKKTKNLIIKKRSPNNKQIGKNNRIKKRKSKNVGGYTNDSKKIIKPIENPEINFDKISSNNNNILEFNFAELNLMPYEKALKFDERTFCQYYLNLVNYKNIALFSFYLSNDYNSRILKINLFFDIFFIHFGVNALFFNDSTMHQIYLDKGSFNFIYQIPQILYSSLISMVLNNFLKILSLSERNILILKSTKKDFDKESKGIKKSIKIKFILFFIFSFIILVSLGLYLSCFCAVYYNTQFHLMKDTLISFGTSLLSPFIFSLLPGMIRLPALKLKKSKCLFGFSKLIQMI